MARRAGRRLHKKARERRKQFLRENFGLVLGIISGYSAMVAVYVGLLYLLGLSRWLPFLMGAALVGGCWLTAELLELDGSQYLRDATFGERLTSEAFGKLRRHGWHVIDRVEFDGFDVDHVAFGPGGVLAIETKWTNIPWKMSTSGLEGPYRDPVQQARDGARKIGRLLHSGGINIPVVPALVLWGRGAPAIDGGAQLIGGVAVLRGTNATQWRSELLADHLDEVTVLAIREVLDAFVTKRDDYEARRSRPSA